MLDWFRSLFGARQGRTSRAYRHLLNRVFGDERAAERLVAFEQKRDPGLSRDQAIAKALDRLDYERSR